MLITSSWADGTSAVQGALMAKKGIVLTGNDPGLEKLAQGKGYAVRVDPGMAVSFDKTLFVEPGGEVPWDLLPAAWHFLERWDAAAPLWRYGVNACDVGSKDDQKRTAAVVRDLRVLLHSVELLFVRNNEDGHALMAAYRTELAVGGDRRLAFLRAYYETKPRLCVLPRSWQAKVYERSKLDARTASASQSMRRRGQPLVAVEISPGRFVKCHRGDEEKVMAMYRNRRTRRQRRAG